MERRIFAASVAEAAAKLGVHPTTLYRRIYAGRIAAVRQGKEWKVFLLSLGGEVLQLPRSAIEDIAGPYAEVLQKGE